MDVDRLHNRLHDLLSEFDPAIWDFEVRTQQLYVSDALRSIYGIASGTKVNIGDFHAAIVAEDRPTILTSNAEFICGKNLRYRIRHPERGVRWIKSNVKARTDANQTGLVVGYTGLVEDITEEVEAAHALLESEERLRFAVEAGKMAIWECDLETGTVTITPELNKMFGFPSDARPTLSELRSRYAPGEIGNIASLGATWEIVRDRIANGMLIPRHLDGIASNENRTQVQVEFSIVVPPGITKHLLYRAQYVYSLEGRPKITGILVDITENRRVEDRLAVIVQELRHRVKNSFSVVQALARQSLSAGEDVDAALKNYLGRVQALFVANEVLFETQQDTVDLTEIALRITEPYRSSQENRFQLTGPPLPVEGPSVTAFSLVLHELSTNALKHGALSRTGGEVLLSWKLEDGCIVMDWRECNGPPVTFPARQGFGKRLLENMVSVTLRGTLDLSYDTEGFSCRIVAPHR